MKLRFPPFVPPGKLITGLSIINKNQEVELNRSAKILTLITILLIPFILIAQTQYKVPSKEVIDIVDAPLTPSASISPQGTYMLLTEMESMPTIEYLSQPLLRIAGVRITPSNNSMQRTSFALRFTIRNLETGKEVKTDLPEGGKFGGALWSNDDKWFALPQFLNDGIKLWLVDTKTGKSKSLINKGLNLTIGQGFSWLPDNRHLLVYMIPEKRGAAPEANQVPIGPNIQETGGKIAKGRTYQDLLTSYNDEVLFDYYATSQLEIINISNGTRTKLNKPGIFTSVNFSPDGEYILADRIKRPYSYQIPYYGFAHSIEVWNKKGEQVHLIADLPPSDDIPLNGVPLGPRSIEWRPLSPATLIWVEALDGGDSDVEAPLRDKLVTLSAPFNQSPKEILKLEHRYSGTSWLEENGLIFVSEYNWKKRWATTFLLNADKPETPARKIFDLSMQDAYGNPGRPVTKTLTNGESVIIYENGTIYLTGAGASPDGDRPFLDKMILSTLEKERLYRCKEKTYEMIIDFAGNSRNKIVTRYESKTEVPNYFLVDLKTNERKPLTDFKDPAPQLTGMKKELIRYKRADGVDLSGTLYLPPNYKEGQRLPVVIWAYPIEYSDASTAGQVRGSQYRFTFFRGYSQLFFVTQGYALLDDAQMPVVGDPQTMNDTFIDQIVSSAKAAIDKLDEMGIGDPKRVGVGGHSYGAFMTANLLAHCDLFAAGIARSGAYNRTLTPFGFQSERRTYWEVPEIYYNLSPFMHANKVNEPILLIHGEADNNSGTFPIQSERFYQAVKGHGATARLVMLPHESHGYRARESVLHVLAEMFEWFDKHVKNKK